VMAAMPMNHSWATVPMGVRLNLWAKWTLLVPLRRPAPSTLLNSSFARIRPLITSSWVSVGSGAMSRGVWGMRCDVRTYGNFFVFYFQILRIRSRCLEAVWPFHSYFAQNRQHRIKESENGDIRTLSPPAHHNSSPYSKT
jgi:hypothetical protein